MAPKKQGRCSIIFLNSAKQNGLKQKQRRIILLLFFFVTVDPEGKPESRMVVLRKFDARAVEFTVYTDARTPKIKSLASNPDAELLFYDHKKLCQIRVKASCIEKKKDPALFLQQHEAAQKDYTTLIAPGTTLKQWMVEYGIENHFIKLVFKAYQIDYLRLKRPNHQRAVFTFREKGWQGTFVTPKRSFFFLRFRS